MLHRAHSSRRAETRLSPQARANCAETAKADIRTAPMLGFILHRRMAAPSPKKPPGLSAAFGTLDGYRPFSAGAKSARANLESGHLGQKYPTNRLRWPQGAHCGSVKLVLRALAACEMLHEREIRCRSAAARPAIHADRSKDQWSNSQIADFAAVQLSNSKVR